MNISDIITRVGEVIGNPKKRTIAKALGISPQTLNSWQSRGTIKIDQLGGFCHKHGIRLEWLLEGQGAKYASPEIEQVRTQNQEIYLTFIDLVVKLMILMRHDPRGDIVPALKGLIADYGRKLPQTPEVQDVVRETERESYGKEG
jgi:hypothetical protein